MMIHKRVSNKIKRDKSSQGFTLIELMVSMLIALILLSPYIQSILLINKQTQILENKIDQYESVNAAFTLFAQYFPLLNGMDTKHIGSADKQSVLLGVDNHSIPSNIKKGSDSIELSFYLNFSVKAKDCANTWLSDNKKYQIDFFVDKDNKLRCKGVASKSGRRASVVILEGIEDMQIEYALLDENKNNLFVSASSIEKKHWHRIKAVRIALKLQDIKRYFTMTYTLGALS